MTSDDAPMKSGAESILVMDGRNGGKVGVGWMKRDQWVSLKRERWIEKDGW